jgi:NhaP-type Na+/H+ or K+/H+ antiporter
MMIIWFSGLIRGAIAFALSLKITDHISPHKNILVSITLIIVLMTTIILGGLMAAFAKLIGLSVESNVEAHDYVARASLIVDDRKTALERPNVSWLQKNWRYFDNNYVKKLFGGDLGKSNKNKSEKDEQSSDLPHFGKTKNSRATQLAKFAEIARDQEEDKEEDKYQAKKWN